MVKTCVLKTWRYKNKERRGVKKVNDMNNKNFYTFSINLKNVKLVLVICICHIFFNGIEY